MFVLTYSENELVDSDNKVRAFAKHYEAWAVMAGELVKSLENAGYDPVLPIDGGEARDHVFHGLILGYLDENDAYTEHCEEKWAIVEVPGKFIPEDVAKGMRDRIREANEMYEDSTLGEAIAAGDIYKGVCNELEGYLN